MKYKVTPVMLSLALCGAHGIAYATETAKHNDMDGDSRSDLIWRNADTGMIVFWSGANSRASVKAAVYDPSGSYDPNRYAPLVAASSVDDIYSDNHTMLLLKDLVYGYPTAGLFHSWEPGFNYQLGDGSSCGREYAAVGDFDGDGWADMFCRDPATGTSYFLYAFLFHYWDWGPVRGDAATTSLTWKVAGIGDFDGDDRSDILWRNATTGQNVIWRSGNSATRLGIVRVSNLDWKIAAIGDFNDDGRSDILWRNSRTGVNVIWKSGSYLTPQAVTSVTNLAWNVVATGDFNGDGKWDLVWRNSATGANVIWNSANAATRQALTKVALTWSVLM